MESPRPLEVEGELEFLLRLYKGVGLITTCLRPIMVQELKEGEKQYKRWKKRRWRRRHRGVLRRRQRRLRSALVRSGEGFFAEQRCQSNFISPFLSKAFFRSFVEPQAIFCREESPAAWWQRMKEKSMLSSPLYYQLRHYQPLHFDVFLIFPPQKHLWSISGVSLEHLKSIAWNLMSILRASQEHLKKLSSKLAPMTLNVVNDHVPIFKTTSWLDVQLRNMMGHLAEFGFKAEYQKNLITCGCVWHNSGFAIWTWALDSPRKPQTLHVKVILSWYWKVRIVSMNTWARSDL